jgi:hypothetical protein
MKKFAIIIFLLGSGLMTSGQAGGTFRQLRLNLPLEAALSFVYVFEDATQRDSVIKNNEFVGLMCYLESEKKLQLLVKDSTYTEIIRTDSLVLHCYFEEADPPLICPCSSEDSSIWCAFENYLYEITAHMYIYKNFFADTLGFNIASKNFTYAYVQSYSAPKSHTQAISTITDLQTNLNSMATATAKAQDSANYAVKRLWVRVGTCLYPVDTTTFVGIGTKVPDHPLTIKSDDPIKFALYNASTGAEAARLYATSSNLGLGYHVLNSVTNGLSNTSIGNFACGSITSGSTNAAVGSNALHI